VGTVVLCALAAFLLALPAALAASETDFLWAVEEGDVEAVGRLLEERPDLLKARDFQSNGPLHLAVLEGDTAMLRLLLEHGADASARGMNWQTPLHTALFEGPMPNVEESVTILLEHGARIDARDAFGGATPLHYAVSYGAPETARSLLEHGAGINLSADGGLTPLHVAAMAGRLDMVRLLLERGADPYACCTEGGTPLRTALKWPGPKRDQIVSAFLQAASPNEAHRAAAEGDTAKLAELWENGRIRLFAADAIGWRLAQWASWHGQAEVVDWFVQRGVSLAGTHRGFCTPLELAAIRNDRRIASILVEAELVNYENPPDGATSLHWAVRHGSADVAEVLLDGGADPNARPGNDWLPLQQACLFHDEERAMAMARVLREHGADVNAAGFGGGTALHDAAAGGHAELVRLLLEHGARIDVADEDGMSPIDHAKDNPRVREVLRAHLQEGDRTEHPRN
jgi:ankyrin repeat protein